MLDERLGILRVTMKPLLNTTLFFLLVIVFSGSVSGQDFEETKRLAEQGDATAQTNLGVMYAIGAGLRQNNVRAYAWFSVAAAQGDEDARSKRDIISETLTPEQLPNGTVSKHSLVLPIAEFYREVRSILPTSTSSTQL